jgi:hypothetical protein
MAMFFATVMFMVFRWDKEFLRGDAGVSGEMFINIFPGKIMPHSAFRPGKTVFFYLLTNPESLLFGGEEGK